MGRYRGLSCLVAVTLGFAVAAGEIPPIPPLPVEGVVLTGLLQRDGFTAHPGEISSCEKKSALDLISYRCDVKNSGAVIGTGNSSMKLSFDRLHVFYKSQKGGDVLREFHFVGNWSDTTTKVPLASETRLVLWHYRSQENRIRGFVKLVDHGVFGSVEAVPR